MFDTLNILIFSDKFDNAGSLLGDNVQHISEQ